MKRLTSMMLLGIWGIVLSSTLLLGQEFEKNHVLVGTRLEPREESDKRELTRAKNAEEGMQEVGFEQQTETLNLDYLAQSTNAFSKSQATFVKSLYYTTHPGVYHNPIMISPFIDDIGFQWLGVWTEDECIWRVTPQDEYIAHGWFPSDLIVITPNKSWFSTYTFRLTNQNTGESVAVNLYQGPLYNGLYTHWISAIDYYHNVIYLEDGSAWSMSFFDDNVVKQWLINDTVILGVNDGWLSSSRPNILINVNMLNYAACSAY